MSLEHKLLKACEKGDLEEVKKLVEKGTNIHAQYNIALRVVALRGHLEVVKYLIEKGANIHALDDAALQLAEVGGHTDVIDFLEAALQKQNRRRTIECL